MATIDLFGVPCPPQPKGKRRTGFLSRLALQWDRAIRESLQQLAQDLWPTGYWLGLWPVRRYRLRFQATPVAYTWWVEHDLPPYDRYQCAAYRVRMILDDSDKALVTVQSGTAIYRVDPVTVETLVMTLAQARVDSPLLISRTMGPALDP